MMGEISTSGGRVSLARSETRPPLVENLPHLGRYSEMQTAQDRAGPRNQRPVRSGLRHQKER